MGKIGIKWKENHATKVTKIPKNKRQKYGMNKTKNASGGLILNYFQIKSDLVFFTTCIFFICEKVIATKSSANFLFFKS